MKTIQALLQQIGAASSGSKDVLQSRLFQEVHFDSVEHRQQSRPKSSRILSIDMGIKNLAFCVADVSYSTPKENTIMDVLSWRRLDLTDDSLKASVKGDMQKNLVNEAKGKETDPFAPEFLSQTAYWLLSRNLLLYQPDVILIERQRWRSSSSSAIQQWTVRVNSLEAMLWAILTALRAEANLPDTPKSVAQRKNFSIYAVDPKRVGTYWLDDESPATESSSKKTKIAEKEQLDEEVDEDESALSDDSPRRPTTTPTKKLSRGKAEKKAKIQLLRTWLNDKNPSTSLSLRIDEDEANSTSKPAINFSFHDQPGDPRNDAETTRQTLLYATDTPSARATRAQNSQGIQIRTEDVKKVDDITDCLLQAAAYVAWTENRAKLQTQFVSFKSTVEEMVPKELKTSKTRALENGAKAESQSGRGKKKQQKFTEEEESSDAITEFEALLAAAVKTVKSEKQPGKSRKTKT